MRRADYSLARMSGMLDLSRDEKAVKWCRKAAAQGSEDAKEALAKLGK